MNGAQFLLFLDAAVVLNTYYCFRAMSEGRKRLTGEYEPDPARSELYAAQTDWRR
jgi:hypothetical protein